MVKHRIFRLDNKHDRVFAFTNIGAVTRAFGTRSVAQLEANIDTSIASFTSITALLVVWLTSKSPVGTAT